MTTEHKLNALLNFILSDLFNAPTEDDMLRWDDAKKVLWDGNRMLSHNETLSLIEQARTLKRLDLVKLLMREMKRVGIKKMATESHSWEETQFGKAMLYFQDVLEKKIDNIANLELKGPIKKE